MKLHTHAQDDMRKTNMLRFGDGVTMGGADHQKRVSSRLRAKTCGNGRKRVPVRRGNVVVAMMAVLSSCFSTYCHVLLSMR